jgi:hypothetical protein
MVVLPIREQIILLTTFVVIFIVFWIDEQRKKDENHILNKIFKYTPDYNSDQRTGFGLVTVAAVGSIFSINFFISLTVLIAGLIYLYKGSTKRP